MRTSYTLTAMVFGSFLAGAAMAQSTRPALEAVERDVRTLYQSSQRNIVRVTVPIILSARLVEQEHPLVKWSGQIDPKIMQALAAQHGGSPMIFIESPRPATQSSTQSTTQSATQPSAQNLSPALGETTRIPLTPQTTTVNAEFIGLILDTRGDVLVPLYIDAAYLKAPLQVAVDEKVVTSATVVAADRLTSLTVIRLAEPAGKPVTFAADRVAPGSLVLMFSPTRRAARLGVWTGTADENAVLVDPRGNFSAIVRNGHALFPAAYAPVVRQLMNGGPVKRAQLGVLIHEVGTDDPIRPLQPALGSRPAARVQEVIPNTAAERAGLQAGDLILSLNEEPVEDVATFAAAIANCRGTTQLHILRAGEPQIVPVELTPQ